MFCCVCGKQILVNHGSPEMDGAYCQACYEKLTTSFHVPSDSVMAVGYSHFNPYRTIEIQNCEHIYLTQKGIDIKFELPQEKLKNFEEIIINGIKFVKTENTNEV